MRDAEILQMPGHRRPTTRRLAMAATAAVVMVVALVACEPANQPICGSTFKPASSANLETHVTLEPGQYGPVGQATITNRSSRSLTITWGGGGLDASTFSSRWVRSSWYDQGRTADAVFTTLAPGSSATIPVIGDDVYCDGADGTPLAPGSHTYRVTFGVSRGGQALGLFVGAGQRVTMP